MEYISTRKSRDFAGSCLSRVGRCGVPDDEIGGVRYVVSGVAAPPSPDVGVDSWVASGPVATYLVQLGELADYTIGAHNQLVLYYMVQLVPREVFLLGL